MSTSALSSFDRFDQEYPEALPDRLAWLETHLDVSRGRMLQLMELGEEEQRRLETLPWPEIIKDHETRADRAEHLLTHYLSYFDYDAGKAADFARKFALEEGSAHRLAGYLPALAQAETEGAREALLLRAVQEEGPSFLPVVAQLIASPSATRNGP